MKLLWSRLRRSFLSTLLSSGANCYPYNKVSAGPYSSNIDMLEVLEEHYEVGRAEHHRLLGLKFAHNWLDHLTSA
jgi:hypothetical protein